ncbi:Dothistromin biosynthesis peroxidase [Sphaerulina musiva]
MKYYTAPPLLLPILLLSAPQLATAFPSSILSQAASQDPTFAARAAEILSSSTFNSKRQIVTADGATRIFEPVGIFNAEAQLVDVGPGSGHEWIAPGPEDLRGPCPGLNAFANHGFLPHNGYATITQFIEATNSVVGMGVQLAAFLAVLGAGIDGDGISWSIHGTPPPGVGGPLSGFGHGLSGSHNKYESDASPTRPDLYQTGNNYKLIIDQFRQLISMSPNGIIDLNSLTAFRSQRFDDQVSSNPFFFNGPFTGVLVQPAAYTFIYRFMANHSLESPHGELRSEVLQSWFGVEEEEEGEGGGEYVWREGWERIPLNWYKRPIEYPYDNAYFLADAANAAALYPKFLNIGGNTNGPNTFTGLNITSFTSGLFPAENFFTKKDSFACFAYQFAAQAKPDLLGALDVVTGQIPSLTSQVKALMGELEGCSQLREVDEELLMQFQGYRRSKGEGIVKRF